MGDPLRDGLGLGMAAELLASLEDAVAQAVGGVGATSRTERRRRERLAGREHAAGRWRVIKQRAQYSRLRLTDEEASCPAFVPPRCRPVDGGAPHEPVGPPAGGEHLTSTQIMARSLAFGDDPASTQDE